MERSSVVLDKFKFGNENFIGCVVGFESGKPSVTRERYSQNAKIKVINLIFNGSLTPQSLWKCQKPY
jgi:hypothetical protein